MKGDCYFPISLTIMCLAISTIATKKLKEKKTPTYVYKAYRVEIVGDKLMCRGVYQTMCVFHLTGNSRVVSNRKIANLTPKERNSKNVSEGLHAFKSYKKLIEYIGCPFYSTAIFRFTGDPADSIAAGTDGEVVFNALHSPKLISVLDGNRSTFSKDKNKLKKYEKLLNRQTIVQLL